MIIPFPGARRKLPLQPITRQPVKPLDEVLGQASGPISNPQSPNHQSISRLQVIARGNKALKRLAGFIGGRQLAFVKSALAGEEGQWFMEKMEELAALIEGMPVTYGQAGKGDDAICYLHYFVAGYDGYILEKDMEESEDPAEAQWQAHGFVHWSHMPESAGLGYICLPEIFKSHAELDFHFTPTPLREIKRKFGIEVEDPEPAATECLNSDTAPAAAAEPLPPVEIKTQYYKGIRGRQADTSIGLWRITTLKCYNGTIRCDAVLCEDTGVEDVITYTSDSKRHLLASSTKTATEKEIRRVHEEGLANFHELEPDAAGESNPIRQAFARTVPGFQATIGRIATLTGHTPLHVYQLWRKYAAACSHGDQSAILSEFLQWYKQDLDPAGTLDLQATLYGSES